MTSTADLFDLRQRVACVTGASSGIGRHTAHVLAQAGARVVAVARRAEALETLQTEVGDALAPVPGDLSRREELDTLARAAAAPFGPPDIVVHAAGLNPREPADEVTAAGWDAALAVNLTAPFFFSQALVPAMKDKGWGRIVNFASLQTFRAFPSGIAYGAAKGGVGQLTRAMAEAWGPYGITANAIGPGFFPTELTSVVFADEERAARNAAQTCLGRNGALHDLDGPLLFLCAAASNYVTGQVLMVDGGFTAK